MGNECVSDSMDVLLRPLRIGSVDIPNRLCRSATHENMAGSSGIVTDEYARLYERLGGGGVGLIISGHMYVERDGRTFSTMAGIDSDDQIPMLRRTVEGVHRNKVVMFAQLNHAGHKAFQESSYEKRIIAPSKTWKAVAMSAEDICRVVESFAAGAVRVKKAGFDGVQIHAAHAYLIAQFLSKRSNHRHDRYGGSLYNRQRFLMEIVSSVREAVGDRFPVIVKLDSFSSSFMTVPPFLPLISLRESLDTGMRLEQEGVDAVEVSCGFQATKGAYPYRAAIRARGIALGKSLFASASRLVTPFDLVLNQKIWFEEQHNLNHISLFKEKLDIPILAGSCFRNPVLMREVIREGKADMICMCRPFIYDPLVAGKILKGSSESSGCIHCNLCIFLIPLQQPLRCYYGKPDFSRAYSLKGGS